MFISHSSKNKPLADAVVRHLEASGIACWIAPRDIKPGANYGVALLDGLSNCQAVLLLLTNDSNGSQFVMKEAERAVSRKIPILVARFQPVAVSRELEFYISTSQFLEATTPPPQQHFNAILAAVRDMLAAASRTPSVGDAIVMTTPRTTRTSPHLGVFLASLGLLVAAVIGAGLFTAPRLTGFLTNVSQPGSGRAAKPDSTPAIPSGSPPATSASTVAGTTRPPVDVPAPPPEQQPVQPPEPEPEPAPAPRPSKPSSPLEQAVAEQERFKGALATLARTRLANFHREALTISKNGELAPNPGSGDLEIMASCKIQPNMKGYTSLARDLIALLDKAALQKGTITSDGMKTSERYGHDARPHIQTITKQSLDSNNGLLGIFASDVHESLVRQHAGAGTCPYVSFASPFLIYDEKITGEYDSGIRNLHWHADRSWSDLLQQRGTGIVVVLDSTKNSYRHTTWRWFHLSPSDWTTISSHAPWQFKCVLTLTDASGGTVESDSYPLKQYGVGRVDDDRTMSVAPFFVNDDFEHYIPEITLTKSVLVLEEDVGRVKDYTATIEEIPGRSD